MNANNAAVVQIEMKLTALSDPCEAIKDLKGALISLEERKSYFAEGENNTVMIGNVAATSRYNACK